MNRLLQKNSGFFLFYFGAYFGIVIPFLNYDRRHSPDPLGIDFILYLSFYIYWLVLGSIYSTEQLEHKNSGYAFLGILPVGKRDIVLSKYILVFLSVFLYGLFHFFWMGTIFPNPLDTATSRTFIIINSGICLVLAGWFYALIFRYGFAKIGKILLISWILLLIVPFFTMTLILPKLNLTRKDIILFITRADPLAVILLAVVLCSASYLASLRFFSRNIT